MARGGAHEQPGVPVPLERERERIIGLLSQAFAYDNIALDELERRIEQAYHASSVDQLRDLTRDLPGDPAEAQQRRAAPLPEAFAPESDRILSVMAETRRRGVWRPAPHLDVWAVMSDTRLDLREAILSSGVTEFDLRAIMANVQIIVPPTVRVVMQVGGFMASVADEPYEPPRVGSGAPVVRITGFAVMADVKVRVRARRTDPLEDDA